MDENHFISNYEYLDKEQIKKDEIDNFITVVNKVSKKHILNRDNIESDIDRDKSDLEDESFDSELNLEGKDEITELINDNEKYYLNRKYLHMSYLCFFFYFILN